MYSGDIGIFVWVQSDGTYERRAVSASADFRAMPGPLFDTLPETMRKEWQAARTP
jgi:hypothetical protein